MKQLDVAVSRPAFVWDMKINDINTYPHRDEKLRKNWISLIVMTKHHYSESQISVFFKVRKYF